MIKNKAFISDAKKYIKNFIDKPFFEKCDILSYLLISLFFIDCSFSGGGKYLSFGPINFRMIVAVAALIFAIPKFASNIKKHIKNPIFYMFFGFLLYLVFAAIRGYNANNNMEVWVSDIKGFMWLFIVPILVVTVDNKKRFEGILNAIIFGAFVQAIIVIIVHIVCCVFDDGINYFYFSMVSNQIGNVSIISNNVYRIFMNSSPYMILACGILLYKQISIRKLKFKYITTISLFLCCILLSFTRSLFGCVFVVFGCIILSVFIFYRSMIKVLAKSMASILLATLLCICILEFVFEASYFNFALSRTVGVQIKPSVVVTLKNKINSFNVENIFNPDNNYTEDPNEEKENINEEIEAQKDYLNQTDESDNLRAVTKKELKELIVKSPIIGNGLGACSQTRNGPDEYFYYDMLARMGVIGLLLYALPFVYICIFVIKRRKALLHNMSSIALLCGIVGFWAVTWFNPWMNAVLGIAVYSLSCCIDEVLKEKLI